MTASGPAAYGMYSRQVPLAEVVCALNRAGFENEDICMVLSPAHPVANSVQDAQLLDVARDSATSTRTIAWCSKFGAVVIPTVGLFIRSDLYLHAFVLEQNSSSLSRWSRTLLGLGFSENEAERLGHLLSDVGALVFVSCQEPGKASSATELLLRAGAKEAANLRMARAAEAAA